MEQEEGKEEFVSVKNFKPTPFRQSQWEVLDEIRHGKDFSPMELEIIPTKYGVDPMFESFDDVLTGEAATSLYHGGGNSMDGDRQELEGTLIDPAVLETQLREQYDSGFAAGRDEGQRDAQLAIVEKYEQLSTRVHDIWSTLDSQMKNFVSETEKRAVELALAVARRILSTTAEVRPEYIVDIIRVGVAKLGAATPLKVRVSPQDMEFLEVVGLPPELSAQELGAQFIADDSVKSGCVIETDFGEIDLQLETMWRQISADLYGVYK